MTVFRWQCCADAHQRTQHQRAEFRDRMQAHAQQRSARAMPAVRLLFRLFSRGCGELCVGSLRNLPRPLRKMPEHAPPSTEASRGRPRPSICTSLDTRLAPIRKHIGAQSWTRI
jgi:hypothetical protein